MKKEIDYLEPMNDYLIQILTEALGKLEIEESEWPDIQIEKPRDPTHGDAATNLALLLAKPLRSNPRQIAENLVDLLSFSPEKIASAEIAGPGFINFHFADDFLYQALSDIIGQKSAYGQSNTRKGKQILVEFVSANPTGPLTVGHGRNAVLGDTIARLYEWTGATVQREYYFNNAGRQMRILGQSVEARYLELLGKPFDFPEGGYEGDYIRDIAIVLRDELGDELATGDAEPGNSSVFKDRAEKEIFADIEATLQRMNISMDTYFNENTLYEDGSLDDVLEKLRKMDLVYDHDGAVWFRTTTYGKEKDTVLVKSTGEPTYRLPDIAYHVNKLERGYDLCVDIFGADHIDTYPDVLNGVKALGFDESRIDVLVYQFVTIVMDGKPFKMSTRKANFVTLDELMDEVGADVTRFFFLMRSPSTHLEFDIAQARESGEKNPVFYLQYAHARICSILRKLEEMDALSESPDLSLLTHEAESRLIKDMMEFPELISSTADSGEPHRIITYLNNLASDFTSFYHDCRIIGEEPGLMSARAALAGAVAGVLSNGLTILGISAPEKM